MNQRSQSQNNMIHAVFGEVAKELGNTGSEITISLAPTPQTIKEHFIQHYLHGKRTSQSSKAELSKSFELFLDAMNLYLAKFHLGPIEIKGEDAKIYIINQLSDEA